MIFSLPDLKNHFNMKQDANEFLKIVFPQLMLGVFLLSFSYNTFNSHFLIIFILYIGWIHYYPDKRLKIQRNFLQYAQNIWSKKLHFSKLKDLQEDDWVKYEGHQASMTPLLLIYLTNLIILFLEGQYFFAFQIWIFAILNVLTRGTKYASFTRRITVLLLLQVGNVSVCDLNLRRVILTRTFLSLCYFEQMDELFFQLVIFPSCTVLHGACLNSSWLPYNCFFLAVVPIELFRLRGFLIRGLIKTTKYSAPSNQVAIIVLIIPVFSVFFTFGRFLQREMTKLEDENSIFNLIIGFECIVGASSKFFGDYVDGFIQPSKFRRILFEKEKEKNKNFGGNFLSIAWNSVIGIFLICREFRFALLSFTLQNLLLPMYNEYVSGGEKLEVADFKSRIVLYLTLILSFPFVTENCYILLSSSCIWFSFENRQFSRILMENSYLFSIQLFFADKTIAGTVLAIGTCCKILTLASAISTEKTIKFVNQVKNADSFLDHAVKQKYSAIGAALNSILENQESNRVKKNNENLSEPSFMDILEDCLCECRQGSILCHLSSCAIRCEFGTYMTNLETKDVLETILLWKNDFPNTHRIKINGKSGLHIHTDWELLRTVLLNMINGRDDTVVKIVKQENNNCVVNIEIHSLVYHISSYKKKLWVSISQAMNCQIDNFTLHFPIVSNPFIDIPLPSSQPFDFTDNKTDHHLPKGLKIGFLDDNLLTRKTMYQTLREHLTISEDSIVSGANLSEAENFPMEIVLKNCNIAIFDRHLEYYNDTENVLLSGFDLARIALANGFKGCLLMYSADDGDMLSEERFNNDIFHGYIEKTSLKRKFLSELVAGYNVWLKNNSTTSSAAD